MRRQLHPGAWWLWALGLAAAASRTTNPLLLALVIVVAGYVVVARRTATPWAASYAVFVKLALAVLVLRVLLALVFSQSFGGTVLFHVPELPLPHWMQGVRVGGDVTSEALAFAAYDGLRLATLLVCVGAANSLASPARLVKALPAALYEVGVVVTVASSFAPQAVTSLGRIREARQLRGRRTRGLRAVRGLALPVLEGALERSVDLAAAMDSRGFGRRGSGTTRRRRLGSGALLVGLLATVGSAYGLLEPGSPRVLGVPLLVTGCALAAAGAMVGGRGARRTRYRPDPWRGPEWVVAGSGLAAAVVFALARAHGVGALFPSTSPLTAPTLPLLPAAGVLLALLPAFAAPVAVRK
jgi:energy-coupling factor transport system permease protein